MITPEWDELLKEECKSGYFIKLIKRVNDEYKNNIVYPLKDNIFNAFLLTPYKDIKVVILGQDPYHGENEATGLSFSVNKGVRVPPSLVNIYKELKDDLNIDIPNHGDLSSWAKEGVFLLNTILTVKKDAPLSHKNIGWEIFTNKVIDLINQKDSPVVFILWGNEASKKDELITNKNHLILKSSHPSPFSVNISFKGSKVFSKTNKFLIKNNIKPISWQIK